jgi:hypothetical protein
MGKGAWPLRKPKNVHEVGSSAKLNKKRAHVRVLVDVAWALYNNMTNYKGWDDIHLPRLMAPQCVEAADAIGAILGLGEVRGDHMQVDPPASKPHIGPSLPLQVTVRTIICRGVYVRLGVIILYYKFILPLVSLYSSIPQQGPSNKHIIIGFYKFNMVLERWQLVLHPRPPDLNKSKRICLVLICM